MNFLHIFIVLFALLIGASATSTHERLSQRIRNRHAQFKTPSMLSGFYKSAFVEINTGVTDKAEAPGAVHIVSPLGSSVRTLIDNDEEAISDKGPKLELKKTLSTDQAELDKATELVAKSRENHQNANDFLLAACSSPTCAPIPSDRRLSRRLLRKL